MIPLPVLFVGTLFGLVMTGWGVATIVDSIKAFRQKEWTDGFVFLTFASILLSLPIAAVWGFFTIPWVA